MTARLQGKTAIVTGGASGIGFAIARGMAAEGARVCIADLDPVHCLAAAAGLPGGAIGVALDVRSLESIEACVATVVCEAGGVDVLVNCAGVFGMQRFTDFTASEYQRIFDVNVRGTLFMTQAVARRMIEQQRGGAIVSISSGTGRRASPGAALYSASKAAVISLTQAAAQELIAHGIRVNAIAPGAVRTPMWEQVEREFTAALGAAAGSAEAAQVAATPAGRMSTPDEYAGAAVFLACSESSYVVGQTLNVDGGMLLN